MPELILQRKLVVGLDGFLECARVTSLAFTVKEIAAFKLLISLFCRLNSRVDIADRDALAWLNVPHSDDELSPASEHPDTVRSAAMVDQVRGTVKTVSAPQKGLFADAKRVNLQQRVDVHNHAEILNAHCQLRTS